MGARGSQSVRGLSQDCFHPRPSPKRKVWLCHSSLFPANPGMKACSPPSKGPDSEWTGPPRRAMYGAAPVAQQASRERPRLWSRTHLRSNPRVRPPFVMCDLGQTASAFGAQFYPQNGSENTSYWVAVGVTSNERKTCTWPHSRSSLGGRGSSLPVRSHLCPPVPISLWVSLLISFQGRSWKKLEAHLGGKP